MLVNFRSLLRSYTFRQLVVRAAEEYVWWIIRSLPGVSGIFLRYLFLRCTTARLDGFCWISPGCTIVNSYNLSIGKGFAVNRNVLIDALGGIEIGDRSGIGPNSVVIAQEHSMLGDDYFVETTHKRRPIRIGSEVWVGANCFLKAGITIGDRAVIGACSNVMGDVPDNARVMGAPAFPLTSHFRLHRPPPRGGSAS